MSTTTSNYGLFKPELTDAADITAMNQNWDKIDTELKKKTAIPISNDVPSEAYLWIDPDEETVEENHVTDKNNPHGVTAAQVGAIPKPTFVADMNTMTGLFGLVTTETANIPKNNAGVALNYNWGSHRLQYIFFLSSPGAIASRVMTDGTSWGSWSTITFSPTTTTEV